MPLSAQEQRELDQLEFEKLSAEKAGAASNTGTRPNNRGQWGPLQSSGEPDMPGGLSPMVAVDAGMEGGGGALGQVAGAYGGPFAPVTVPLGGFLGGAGGNMLGQLRRGGKFSIGQALGAGAASAVPGAPFAKAGVGMMLKEGAKQAVGNIAGKAIETGVDEGRLPTVGETALAGGSAMAGTTLAKYLDKGARVAAIETKTMQNAVRDQTLAEARAAGYVISPSKVNPGTVNGLLESIAGKAATGQEAVLRNQEITNTLARKAVGLPPQAPITLAALKQVREQAAAPYREIAAMKAQADMELEALTKSKLTADPHEYAVLMADPKTVREMAALKIKAAADVEALKLARHDANENYKFYRASGGDPEVLAKARAAEKLADELDSKIEKAAEEIGRPGLAQELRDGRVRIAKAYQVEKALNLGDANVSAPILGRSLDKGVPMTGELATISKFQQTFPQYAREVAGTPPAGVSQLGAYMALGAAGPKGLAVPLLNRPARSIALNNWYQNKMGSPNYGAKMPDTLAQFVRMGSAAAGRSNPLIEFMRREYPDKPTP